MRRQRNHYWERAPWVLIAGPNLMVGFGRDEIRKTNENLRAGVFQIFSVSDIIALFKTTKWVTNTGQNMGPETVSFT